MSSCRTAKVIMVQGTSSHAGKSVLATALCRIFAQDGLQVAPFKAQNMSLNSYATPDGGEIGRSQAVQAAAAMTAPKVEMNPVLLKPEGERRSQVVVMGKPMAVASAREYYELKPTIWETVTSALATLRADYDVVVIEGAGSPAEVNLKEQDIVNMRVALHADAPVLAGWRYRPRRSLRSACRDDGLAGAGGTSVGEGPRHQQVSRRPFAAHVGTRFPGRTYRCAGRGGDSSLLGHPHSRGGLSWTGRRIQGYDDEAVVDVAVIRLPHIANFDDFDPLRHEPGVRVRYVGRAEEFGAPDLVIIPGSKTTVADLDWLRAQGIEERILVARGGGTPVVGICAGYQMLGERLLDPDRSRVVQRGGAGPGVAANFYHVPRG